MIRLLNFLVGVVGGMGLLLAGLSVVTRYAAPMAALDWSDEVVVILLVWAMLLAGFRLTLERGHVAVDLLTHILPPLAKRVAEAAATICLALYAGLLAVSGVLVTADALALGERTESTLRTPTFLYYAALPAGMGLIALAALMLLAGRAPRREPQPLEPL